MRARRTHTKSRRGCVQCKKRHVKCDEQLPRCSLCSKRRIRCDYPEPPQDEGLEESPTGQHAPLTPQEHQVNTPASSRSDNQAPSARLQEMRLFHHFLMDTGPTLMKDEIDKHHWQMVIPQIATVHDYVMDSMLAFSALHLAHQEPDSRQSWLHVALDYQNQALNELRRELASMTAQDSEPAFLCSALILLFATGYPCIVQSTDFPDPIEKILEIRVLLSGCVFLFDRLKEANVDMVSGQWLCRSRTAPDDDMTYQAHLKKNNDPKLLDLYRSIMSKLDQLHTYITNNSSPNQQIYLETCQQLQSAVKPWSFSYDGSELIGWPIHASDLFIHLLKEGDWMARILFLLYGLGMHLLSKNWYAKDSGRMLVLGVLNPLQGNIPPNWVEMITSIREAVDVAHD